MVYFYSKKNKRNKIETKNSVKVNYVINIHELIEKILKLKTISLDTETTGLNPIEDNVVMIQFGNKNDQYIIDTRDLDFSILFPIFKKETLYVGHNLKFDYNMLKKYGIVLHNIYDTMLAEMVLMNGKNSIVQIIKKSPYSLKSLVKKYLDIDIGKDTRKEFLYCGDRPFTLDQIIYGATDVSYLGDIMSKQTFKANELSLNSTLDLEFRASLALGDIEYNGFHLDPTKWLKTNKEFKLKLRDTLVDLDNELIKTAPKHKIKAVQLDIFTDVMENVHARKTDVNWNSPIQVLEILTKDFKISPTDKDGKQSSGSKALEMLENKPPIVQKLLNFRKQSKAVTSFGEEFLKKFLYPDNRVRTHFNSIVETGRVSSRKPNMQQIPRDNSFRSCFIPSTDNHVLITADYSNQEGRIMADMSEDTSYIDFFNNGDGDAHSFVATTVFSAAYGKEFKVTSTNENKEYRQKGKVLNFFISFGGSAYTLSKNLKIDLKEAEYLIENFFKGFPGLKILFDKSSSDALENGFIRTNPVTNRLRWIREWNKYQELLLKPKNSLSKEDLSLMYRLKGRIERKGKNTPIQGTAGDMTKTALILIRKKLDEYGINPFLDSPIKLVSVVHDEISLETTKEFKELGVAILKECMEKAGTLFCKKIGMKVDPVVSNHWIH